MRNSAFLLLSTGLLFCTNAIANTKCFLVTENNQTIQQIGDCESRYTPNSTFKIALSVMGYDEGFLKDETHPTLPYKEGYSDFLAVWKEPHNPSAWIKNSCVWYSQVIAQELGIQKLNEYLAKFNYGNQDLTGDKGKNNGLVRGWISSSLKISPIEQTEFLKKLINEQLPVSKHAQQMTKNILFVEELDSGWQLYGKTGSGYLKKADGTLDENRSLGWFIGWIQKGENKIIFTHYIEEENQDVFAGKRAKEAAKEKLLTLIQNKDNPKT